jgi:hypothetical protein
MRGIEGGYFADEPRDGQVPRDCKCGRNRGRDPCSRAGGRGGAAASEATGQCPVSHVHYGPDLTAVGGLRSIPWIATAPAGTFHAHLFYYGATPWPRQRLIGARIFTTVRPRKISPKVLWVPRKPGAGQTLVVSGTRLDGAGRFSKRYPRASGNQFPSYVKVPAAGCWRITVRTGQLVGKGTFVAVDSY